MKKRSRARSTESIQFARNQRRSSNEFASTVRQSIRNRLIDGDGYFKEEGRERDRLRDQYLTSLGYKILRILGYAVTGEGGTGVQTIREFVRGEIATQSPSPPHQRFPAKAVLELAERWREQLCSFVILNLKYAGVFEKASDLGSPFLSLFKPL